MAYLWNGRVRHVFYHYYYARLVRKSELISLESQRSIVFLQDFKWHHVRVRLFSLWTWLIDMIYNRLIQKSCRKFETFSIFLVKQYHSKGTFGIHKGHLVLFLHDYFRAFYCYFVEWERIYWLPESIFSKVFRSTCTRTSFCPFPSIPANDRPSFSFTSWLPWAAIHRYLKNNAII